MVNLLSGTKTPVFNIGTVNVFTGSGQPSNAIGKKGDLFIDIDTPKIWQKGAAAWITIDSKAVTENVIYVGKEGSDSNDGRSAQTAKRTIKHACATIDNLINLGTFEPNCGIIFIGPGVYTETCPIVVPEGVTLLGLDKKSVLVKSNNPNSNVFYMESGSSYLNFSVVEHRLSPSAFNITPTGFAGYDTTDLPLTTSQTGWAFSFSPGSVITTSPRLFNISSISGSGVYGSPSYVAGGGGLLVDSSTISNSSTTSTVITENCDMVNLGGIGYKAVNKGHVEATNNRNNFCQFGALALAGGHIVLKGSSTSYGNYSLWAEGNRTLVDSSVFGSLIEAPNHTLTYAGSGVDYTKVPVERGGDGVADANKFTIIRSEGRIFQNTSDEKGNFYLGEIIPGEDGDPATPKFRISQEKDLIDGRIFYQSVFGMMIPLSLALIRRK